MGHEIVYCVRCATRIVGVDFERDKAFRVGGKAVCAACVPSLTPLEQKEVSLSSTKMKAVKQAAPSQSTSSRLPAMRVEHLPLPTAPPASSSKTPLVIAGVIGAIVVIAGLTMALRPTAPPNPPPAPVAKTELPPPASVEKREDPLLRDAREALDAARAKMKSAPNDLDGQLAAWEEAARKTALTPFFKEASAGLQEAKDRRAAAKPPSTTEPEKPVVKAPVEPPPASQPSAESKAYLVRWEQAMIKATARDFDGAIADLGRAAAEAGDDAVRRDARADAEELQRARAMLAEGQDAFATLPRGQRVGITSRDGSGERRRIEGDVVRAGRWRVEMRQGEAAVFVETEDVSAATLATLLGTRADADRKALAVLCLLEGDREPAERLAGIEALPPRYWGYAKDAASKVPRPSPREMEARNRFYAAEAEFAKVDTLAAAVQKYRSLAQDYADTRVVKSEAVRVQKRSEAGRDYVFMGAALKGTGTFSLGPAPRIEVAWASKSDVEGSAVLENYVEADFAAMPDLTYRCWALVGACCAETFVFYLQTTEGTDLHPKTRQKTSIDPGAPFASVVKHSISGLKKTHEEHKIKGSKTHPKTAARWEWVPIPLPKYAAAGAKKVRLISEQQGFAVGAIVVSATRTGPLPEAEFKEEVARARALVMLEDGLIGWWRFEERTGAVAGDTVDPGHPGQVKGPKWGEGRVGGGLKFEGADEVGIGAFKASFQAITVSAWVKHDSLGPGVQRYVTVGNETAVIRRMSDQSLQFYILTDGQQRHVIVHNMLEVGKWTHVVGTWDGTTQKFYKNGAVIGSQAPGGRLTGDVDHVLISAAGEPMRGSIDEVRLYTRALSEAEIQKQYQDGAGEISTAPASSGKPWRPLFDGSSLACLRGGTNGWKVENGTLTYIPGSNDAAQTREEMGDGELRVRFEVKDAERLWFNLRQGESAGYGVAFEGDLKPLEGKPHELIFTAKGDQVTAMLDGKPVPVVANGPSKSGCLQFNARGETCRILSLDVR